MSDIPEYTRRAKEILDQVWEVTPIPDGAPDIKTVGEVFVGRMMHMTEHVRALMATGDGRDMLVAVCIMHNMTHECMTVNELTLLSVPEHIIYEANLQGMDFLGINIPDPNSN